jgi:hypothetical protein
MGALLVKDGRMPGIFYHQSRLEAIRQITCGASLLCRAEIYGKEETSFSNCGTLEVRIQTTNKKEAK